MSNFVEPSPGITPSPTPPADGGDRPVERKVENNVENSTFGNATFVSNARDVTTMYVGSASARPFSDDAIYEVPEEHARMVQKTFVSDEATVERLLQTLERRRVLFLAGERGSGRQTTAVYLATRIVETRKLKKPTGLIDPIDKLTAINLPKVIEKSEKFADRVVILPDALSKRNRDLQVSFSSLNTVASKHLAELLSANETYLIVTMSESEAKQLQQQIPCHQIAPLSVELVARGAEKRMEWLQQLQPAHAGRLATIQPDQLANDCRTMPSVVEFLDRFIDGDMDYKTAIDEHRKIDYWFKDILAADIDAWCSVVTLALTHSVRDAESVSWFEFEQLRRAIAARVRSDTEIFPRRRIADAPDAGAADDPTTAQRLDDDELLKHCRIVVERRSDAPGDKVRFGSRDTAESVWKLLLEHNRRVVTMLLSMLRDMAADARTLESLRNLAAQMIGRLAEIDPRATIFPLIERQWGDSDDERRRLLVGGLMEGVLGSSDTRYRRAALDSLNALANRPGEGRRARLLTTIGAYSHLGVYEPETAMQQLGALALRHFVPMIDAELIGDVSRVMKRVDQKLATADSIDNADDLLVHGVRGLGKSAHEFWPQFATSLMALERSIVYLCLKNDPIQVLRLMRDWITQGGPPAGMLVTLLFLHEDGIAADLEEWVANDVSPTVTSLAIGRDAVHQLCGFLADLHFVINAPFSIPADVQSEFRERFAASLTAWARGAAESSIHRGAVIDLFGALTAARGGAMREEIYTVIGRPPFTENDAMRSFAAEVRTRM